jgi:hypothetical protein
MSNEPENTTPETTERFSPDNVRENALSALEEIQNATLNIGRITDPEYLASLSAAQLGRIKKVITDRNGVIVSVELNDTVGLLLAKANIAGVKENTAARNREKLAKLTAEASAEAKAKAEVKKSELKKKEEKSKYKSNKLIISVKSAEDRKEKDAPSGTAEPKSDAAKKEKSNLFDVMNQATGKKQ